MARPTGDRIHRKAINTPGHAHELTFSCYHRFQFLKAERCCQWLAESIGKAQRRQAFWLWAYVIMPDHVHLIVYPFTEKYRMHRIIESIKQPVGAKAIGY